MKMKKLYLIVAALLLGSALTLSAAEAARHPTKAASAASARAALHAKAAANHAPGAAGQVQVAGSSIRGVIITISPDGFAGILMTVKVGKELIPVKVDKDLKFKNLAGAKQPLILLAPGLTVSVQTQTKAGFRHATAISVVK
jgi:hypothetical protein